MSRPSAGADAPPAGGNDFTASWLSFSGVMERRTATASLRQEILEKEAAIVLRQGERDKLEADIRALDVGSSLLLKRCRIVPGGA